MLVSSKGNSWALLIICSSLDTSRDTICQTSLWSTRNINCQTKRKHVGWIRASGLYSHSAESSVGARQHRWDKERWNLGKFLTRVLPYILDFHVAYGHVCGNANLQSMCSIQETGLQEAGLSYHVSRRKLAQVHRLGSWREPLLTEPACLFAHYHNSYTILGNMKRWFQFFLCRHTMRSEAGVYNLNNIAKCVRNECLIRWDTETFQSH